MLEKSLARRPYTVFFYLRLTVLLSLLGLSVVGWRFVQQLGGPTQIIPELLRTHVQREEDSASALEARVAADILALQPSFTNTLGNRISAARSLAEEGLARKKTYEGTEGLLANLLFLGNAVVPLMRHVFIRLSDRQPMNTNVTGDRSRAVSVSAGEG